MFFTETWFNVPDGSVLEVRVDTGAGAFGVSGSHAVVSSGFPPRPLGSGDFPLDVAIRAGEQHKVKFDVVFAGTTGDVTVTGRVVRPDGSEHGVPASATATLSDAAGVFTVKLSVRGVQ